MPSMLDYGITTCYLRDAFNILRMYFKILHYLQYFLYKKFIKVAFIYDEFLVL
jgi:hypothetical protein